MQNGGSIYTKPTFLIALVVMLLFVLLGTVWPVGFKEQADDVFAWMLTNLGWTFILGASAFLFLIVFLLLSPVGEIRLGADDEKPAYGNLPWFAMLFSCGMGIGLLFWGVSEPINHLGWSPVEGAEYTSYGATLAMRYSFFHWGFHPWAIYAVVAGSLAYFSYRKGLPMLLSSCLEPILGRKGIEGPIGIIVNVIGVFATVFGLATSLGLGAMQIGAGLESLFGISSGPTTWITIIIIVTIAAIISTSTGIDRGIKYLSQVNIIAAALLMLLVFIVGPTLFILNMFSTATGDYLQNIVSMSFNINPLDARANDFATGWTVFYWAWWIAWAPFVGTFIARISRGRTIRNFIVGVMLVPVAVSMVWFTVFGGSALYAELFGDAGGRIIDAVGADSSMGFFALLQGFPLSPILIAVGVFSVAIFFITSSDSGTYVNGMLTSGGDPNPPLQLRIIWGAIEGTVAAVLLLGAGALMTAYDLSLAEAAEAALKSLQTASVVGGFPFMIIMFLMLYCLMKSLFAELREGTLPLEKKRIQDALEELKAGK